MDALSSPSCPNLVPQFLLGGLVFSSVTASVWCIVYLLASFVRRWLDWKPAHDQQQKRVHPVMDSPSLFRGLTRLIGGNAGGPPLSFDEEQQQQQQGLRGVSVSPVFNFSGVFRLRPSPCTTRGKSGSVSPIESLDKGQAYGPTPSAPSSPVEGGQNNPGQG